MQMKLASNAVSCRYVTVGVLKTNWTEMILPHVLICMKIKIRR